MGSSSQVSTTGSTSHHSIETPDVDMHDGDESFSSTTLSPTSGPSSYGLNTSKRQKMSRTSSPTPPGLPVDNKMYEFIDTMISKHGEEKYTGYKKKIQEFCKVLASVMEEIPETYYNEYMQECLKTLHNFQADSYVVLPVGAPTTDITSNVVNFTNMLQLQTGSIQQFQTASNVVRGPIQQIPTSSNSNQQFPIPIASNADITPHLNVAQFPAPAPPKPPQILTDEPSTSNTGTSNVTITSVSLIPKNQLKDKREDTNIYFNMTSQMMPQINTASVDNSNYGLQTEDTLESEGDSMETQSPDSNDDALNQDGQGHY